MPTDTSDERRLKRHLYLDGLRYSANMTSLAYQRLTSVLAVISDTSKPEPQHFTSAFLDSWSTVDSAFRYRNLVTSMPGLSQKEPPMRMFLQKTLAIEDLRHYMQHPNTQDHFKKLKASTSPFLGVLVWVRTYSKQDGRIFSLIAGSLPYGKATIPAINPLARATIAPVDLVHLHVASSNVSLSDVTKEIVGNYETVSKISDIESLDDLVVSTAFISTGDKTQGIMKNFRVYVSKNTIGTKRRQSK